MKEVWLLKLLGIFLPFILWELVSRFSLIDSFFFPSPGEVFTGMADLFVKGVLFTSVMVSLWRAISGMLIAFILAVPLALILGTFFPKASEYLNPMFRFFAQVNPFSLMPVFILFFGIGESAKLAVVSWVSLWPLFFNTLEGARTIDPALIKTARAAAGSSPALLLKVILPGAASPIFAGVTLSLEMSFFILVAAEMIGATYGLGWLLHNSAMNLAFVRMYAAIVTAVLISYVMNQLLMVLRRRLFFWREGCPKNAHAPRDAALAAAMVLLIFAVGFRQLGAAKAEQRNFNHIPHSAHMSAGGGGME